jgi:thiamine transport system permease protein
MQIAVTGIVLAALALLPAPDDLGPASGKRSRRIDGETLSALLWDGMLLLLAALFVGLPLFSVVLAGLKADLPKLATQPVFLQALATSLAIALAAGLIAVSAALAIVRACHAIAAARDRNIARRSLGALLDSIPSLVLLAPPIVLATGWFMALRALGDPTDFAVPLIIGINMLMALPFVIRVVEPAYRIHRQHTERLALSLGLEGISRWRLVDWPGLRHQLLTGLSFAMALSLGDLGAVALFGSGNLVTLPWLVYSRLGSYRSNDADGFALLLGLVCLALTIAGTTSQSSKGRESNRHG